MYGGCFPVGWRGGMPRASVMLAGFRIRQTRPGMRGGRAQRGGFRDHPARTCMRLPRGARRPVHFPRSCALVLLAHSTVVRAAGTTAMGGGRKGVWGNMEPGP